MSLIEYRRMEAGLIVERGRREEEEEEEGNGKIARPPPGSMDRRESG